MPMPDKEMLDRPLARCLVSQTHLVHSSHTEVILLRRPEKATAILALAAASAIVACSQPSPVPTPPPVATTAPAASAAAPTPAPTTAPVAVSPVVKPVVAPSPAISPVAAASASPVAAPTPLSAAVLTDIQPALSHYMLETAKRMGRSWFAAQGSNWDEAAFEIREASEVLDHGGLLSEPDRQKALTAFNAGFLAPLVVSAQAGDKAAYEAGYTGAIQGCNACHATQTYDETDQPFSFIRVQVPKTNIWDVYAYAK
jgi:hypothetical protein